MTRKTIATLAHVAPPTRVLKVIDASGKAVYWVNGVAKYKTEQRKGRYITCRYNGYSPFDTPDSVYAEDNLIGDGPKNADYPHDLKTKGIAVEDIA